MRTVELTVDPGLDDRVRSVWRRLHAAGLPSLATHRHSSNRPHLTLTAATELTAGVAAALTALPLTVELGPTTFFPGRAGALVWLVTPDEALLELHAEVWAALDGVERNPITAPGVWVPHVSLALRTRPEHREAAAALLADLPPARGSFVSARSYDPDTRGLLQLA